MIFQNNLWYLIGLTSEGEASEDDPTVDLGIN